MTELSSSFRDNVYHLVVAIPEGRVMTYGDIAACAGHAHAARVVGQIAHYGPEELPWHRVVNRFGGLARGYWGGKEIHRQMLEHENIVVDDEYCIVNFEEYRWQPPMKRPLS